MGAKSPLLKLPPELRNWIYTSIVPTHVTTNQYEIVPHALTRTCRQLRAEFLSIFTDMDKSQATTITLLVPELSAPWSACQIIDTPRLQVPNIKLLLDHPKVLDFGCLATMFADLQNNRCSYKLERRYTVSLAGSHRSVHLRRKNEFCHDNMRLLVDYLWDYLKRDEDNCRDAVLHVKGVWRLAEIRMSRQREESLMAGVGSMNGMIRLVKIGDIV